MAGKNALITVYLGSIGAIIQQRISLDPLIHTYIGFAYLIISVSMLNLNILKHAFQININNHTPTLPFD
jgi:hypothetical protein